MKLAIVGGRTFNDYEKFKAIVKEYIEEYETPETIISGGAEGVDTMAEWYAREYHIPLVVLKPNWYPEGKYNHRAGLDRNTDIIDAATHVLALPTVISRGTHDSIRKAQEKNKIIKVIDV